MKRALMPGNRLFFLLMVAFACVTAFFSIPAAAAEGACIVIAALFYRRRILNRRRDVVRTVDQLSGRIDAANGVAHCPLPMLIVRAETGELIWANEPFIAVSGLRERFFTYRIGDVIPGFDLMWLIRQAGRPASAASAEAVLCGRQFAVYGNLVRTTAEGKGGREKKDLLATLYFIDVTELMALRKEYRLSRTVVAVLMIDNYDECVKNLTEGQKSGILAAADGKITAWAAPLSGVLRKYDRDRYLVLIEEREMAGLIERRFSVLDDIRSVIGPSGVPVTLSIGIGRDGETLAESFSFAQLAIDMALSRGGDQAVIKNRINFEFFGGRAKEVEKRTKVKSRVVAQSLSKIISDSSLVLVMGHAFGDIDSLGASAGICCIARKCGKRAFIVVDENKTMAAAMLTRLREHEAYSGVFIDGQTALLHADNKSLLVIVDCNRPEIVESGNLLRSMNRVVVIDHHRRSANYIDDAILVMHEPYASSACELVCELSQYICGPGDLLRCEAEAMMAGIVLDTKGFTMHTGARTFEAAAFLRGSGADPVEIKRLFQNDMQSSMERYEIITCARIVRNNIAVSAVDREADRAVAAQAADEMLNIIGISASFVLFRSGKETAISGRSLGEVNVQMILEKLGGGGHQTIAGAQLPGLSVDEALDKLMGAIDQYCEENDISNLVPQAL